MKPRVLHFDYGLFGFDGHHNGILQPDGTIWKRVEMELRIVAVNHNVQCTKTSSS